MRGDNDAPEEVATLDSLPIRLLLANTVSDLELLRMLIVEPETVQLLLYTVLVQQIHWGGQLEYIGRPKAECRRGTKLQH